MKKTQLGGIIVPDMSGCFSAADTEKDIQLYTQEAILTHLKDALILPEATSMSSVNVPKGFALGFIDVDLSELKDLEND